MSSSHDMTSTHSDDRCHALAADLLPRRSVGAHIPWAAECSAAHRSTYEGQVRPAECGANLAARRDADAEATRRRRPPQRLRQHPPRKRRCPQEIPCPWKPCPLTPSTWRVQMSQMPISPLVGSASDLLRFHTARAALVAYLATSAEPSCMRRASPIGRSQGSTARVMCSTGAASHAQHARPTGCWRHQTHPRSVPRRSTIIPRSG